jgi:CBS domain-containing protein
VVRVSRAMQTNVPPLGLETTASSALQILRQMGVHAWPVADGMQMIGMITVNQLANGASDAPLSDLLPHLLNTGLSSHNFPHLHADQSLDLALQRMGETHLDVLPVVSRDNIRNLRGVLTLAEVLRAYGIAKDSNSG